MLRTFMRAKIHRARVTQADLNYVGSLTLDATLMKAANIAAGEQIDVVDITNGARLTTYVIEGEPDSGVVCINGAAAHHVFVDDLVILICYGLVDDSSVDAVDAKVLFVDDQNRPDTQSSEPSQR